MPEFTGPLKNGSKLPLHPEGTTGRKVVKYGEVTDCHNGIILTAGLHRSEIDMLRRGEVGGLGHLYRYAFVQVGPDMKIFHTRPRVKVEVQCIDDGDVQ